MERDSSTTYLSILCEIAEAIAFGNESGNREEAYQEVELILQREDLLKD